MDHLAKQIVKQLCEHTGEHWVLRKAVQIPGGDINQALMLDCQPRALFVKYRHGSDKTMYQAEALALGELARSEVIAVPSPLLAGCIDAERSRTGFLALEWLPMRPRTPGVNQAMGHALARLHRCTQQQFGWPANNFIGMTPQENYWSEDWPTFFGKHRLRYQASLLGDVNLLDLVDRLVERLGRFFTDYQPVASLLHGDLWSGNAGALADGSPVVYDPASYYGDRETDLAMTELFGGFGSEFYVAYEQQWPLDEGYQRRRPLYQLYHLLNHANLFGGSYLPRCAQSAEALLRVAGS